MKCPFCQTENRDDREECYYCHKDLSMLRLIVNKAKHHYNQALEYAERNRVDDAIGELRNTLDLDGTMVGAWVVLGTLYAKKEDFAQAQQCWQQALAIDSSYEKAHQYLEKAQSAQYVFPALRRLKGLAAGLSLLLVLVAAAAVWGFLPDRGVSKVHESLQYLAQEPIMSGEAKELLGELDEKKSSKIAWDMSQSLQKLLSDYWQEQLDLAALALNNDDPYFALKVVSSLEHKNPDPSIKGTATNIRRQAAQTFKQMVLDASDAYYSDQITFEQFDRKAENLLSIVPKGNPEHAQIAQLREQIQEDHHAKLYAQAASQVVSLPLPEASLVVAEWEQRNPDKGKQLRDQFDLRLQTEAGLILANVEGLIGKGSLDQARQEIGKLTLLYQKVNRTAPQEQLEALRGAIDKAEQRSVVEMANAAFENGQWEQFIELTQNLPGLTADPVEQAKLAQWRTKALESWAKDQWDWFSGLDARFETGRITAEQAARAIKISQEVADNLPKSLRYARGPILFYTASAHMRLGQAEQCRQLLEQVRADHPKSYIIKSVDNFSKRFSKELATEQEAQPQEQE